MGAASPDRFNSRSVHDEISVLLDNRVVLTVWTDKFFKLLEYFCHVQLRPVLNWILLLLDIQRHLIDIRMVLTEWLLCLNLRLWLNVKSLPVLTVFVRSAGAALALTLQNLLCVLTDNVEVILDELDVELLLDRLIFVFTSCYAETTNLQVFSILQRLDNEMAIRYCVYSPRVWIAALV